MIRKAETVPGYLSSLTPEERKNIQKVRGVIRRNLPKGYQESVQWGMICYSVPLSRYSDTYNQQALCYAALAAHKQHRSLYLMTVYGTPAEEKRFKARFKASGKKLDMGKSCVRFKSADDLPLDVIGETIASTAVDDFISRYEKGRAKAKAKTGGTAAISKRKAAKKR